MRADGRASDCGRGAHRGVDDHVYYDQLCGHGVVAHYERDPSGLSDHGLNDHGPRHADVHDPHGFDLHENRVSEQSGSSGHGLCGCDVSDPDGRGVSAPSGHGRRESVRGVHGQKR